MNAYQVIGMVLAGVLTAGGDRRVVAGDRQPARPSSISATG